MDTPHGCISTCAQCNWRKIRVRGIQNKERIISPLLKKNKVYKLSPFNCKPRRGTRIHSRHRCKIQI